MEKRLVLKMTVYEMRNLIRSSGGRIPTNAIPQADGTLLETEEQKQDDERNVMRHKTHTLCSRCGSKAYHLQKSTCGKCGPHCQAQRKV
ncbi:hypothetical protein STEG23_031784 [Scotinomys teguina]